MTDKLIVEANGPITNVILNNPEKRNAINYDMWCAIGETFSELSENLDTRVVIVSGAGDKAFSAGADISEFAEKRGTPEGRIAYEDAVQGAFAGMRKLPVISIAMIDGVCVGGGAEVAMECDILMSSDRSRFGITPAKLGIGYVLADIERLVNNLGAKSALEILATGKLYSPEEALALGWIRSISPAAELESDVLEMATTISENAPLTIKASKQLIKEALKPDNLRDHALCDRLVEACYLSEDTKEGQLAFAEKRKPHFKGR